MLVSNNSLLNILLPNNNKVIKEALKDADSKTLQDMVKNKSTSVNDVLKNLFDDIKNGTKTNSNIENILKNTNIFKDLGSFSKSLSTILNQIDTNDNLDKYKPTLQAFLKNITNMDENSLKEQINKSGVFLESKIAQSTTSNEALPKNIEKLLNQIQTILKDINTPLSKQISELINKIVQQSNSTIHSDSNISNMKNLVSLLQNITNQIGNKDTQNLTVLTNKLKTIINEGSIIESKIDNIIKDPKIETSNLNNLNNSKEQINSQTKEILSQIKNEVLISKDTPLNKNNILNQIDNLLKSNDLFNKNDKTIEPKALLNNLLNSNEIKQASNINQNVSNLVLNLKNISENISNLEIKANNFVNIQEEKASLTNTLKENLSNLKSELQNLKNLDTNVSRQIINKLENIQNIFNKIEVPVTNIQQNFQNTNIGNFPNNLANNLNSLILSLKETILNLSSNQNNSNTPAVQNQILNVIEKIEVSIKENIQNQNFNQQSNIVGNKELNNPINSDMKSVLLQMQEELSNKTDLKSQELFKQVDKMLMQIDYHQLLSITSNSNYVYVPFLWDMLEDGSISMKKSDEDKFFCQINLTLKDFGKVDLMLGIYDKNKIDITIHAQREHFKVSVRENIQKLKVSLNDVGLIPVNIKLLDLKEEEQASEKNTNVYNTNPYNNDFNSGIDIRV